jgi:hypothetical protein
MFATWMDKHSLPFDRGLQYQVRSQVLQSDSHLLCGMRLADTPEERVTTNVFPCTTMNKAWTSCGHLTRGPRVV